MTLLGIDYGTKKVGVAVSDASERIAFPLAVLTADSQLLARVAELIETYQARGVVFGESIDLSGKHNALHQQTVAFANQLTAHRPELQVYFVDERFSTQEARHKQAEMLKNAPKTKRPIDAHAAAVILQYFLDQQAFLENA